MRLLFNLDTKDYTCTEHEFSRPSVRAIVIKDGKVGMIHSLKYDYYAFPGGGIESGETQRQALIRETQEEAGLVVIPQSIKEYGNVHRVSKSDQEGIDIFVQDNFSHANIWMPMKRMSITLWSGLLQNRPSLSTAHTITAPTVSQSRWKGRPWSWKDSLQRGFCAD